MWCTLGKRPHSTSTRHDGRKQEATSDSKHSRIHNKEEGNTWIKSDYTSEITGQKSDVGEDESCSDAGQREGEGSSDDDQNKQQGNKNDLGLSTTSGNVSNRHRHQADVDGSQEEIPDNSDTAANRTEVDDKLGLEDSDDSKTQEYPAETQSQWPEDYIKSDRVEESHSELTESSSDDSRGTMDPAGTDYTLSAG